MDSLTWEHEAERPSRGRLSVGVGANRGAITGAGYPALTALAATPPYRAAVGWLRCFRGIDTLTAITILAELHDVRRFPTARALMAYLGLVPGEHSSGETTRRGRITKTGNTLVRRVLTEAAWQYPASPGHREGPGAAARRATRAGDRHRRQGPTALVWAFPPDGADTDAPAEDRGGDGPRTRGIYLGGLAAPAGHHVSAQQARCAKTTDDQRHDTEDWRKRYVPRSATTREPTVLDCHPSRRITVMRALPRLAVVIAGYQRDSSSKRPSVSVVLAHRRPDTNARGPCRSGGRRGTRPPLRGKRAAFSTGPTGP